MCIAKIMFVYLLCTTVCTYLLIVCIYLLSYAIFVNKLSFVIAANAWQLKKKTGQHFVLSELFEWNVRRLGQKGSNVQNYCLLAMVLTIEK